MTAESRKPRVKICGVTDPANASGCVAAGADFLGLNFWPGSKRYLAAEHATAVVNAARAAGPIQLVGVFVDADLDTIRAAVVAYHLDIVQLHGAEDPDAARAVSAALGVPVWKAIGMAGAAALEHLPLWDLADPAGLAGRDAAARRSLIDALVLDTATPGHGGSGAAFDWALAAAAKARIPGRRFVLAGGLTPGNVAAAIAVAHPWAVDVASGVESAPGVKDLSAVASFVSAARI